jgi:hypothetical protein
MEEEEASLKVKILTHKLTPILCGVLLVLFFFKVIPDSTADNYKYFFALFGGAISIIISLWIVGLNAPILFEKIPILSGVVCISTFFIFGYLFITKTSEYANTELTINGVKTEAIVIGKSRIYGKGGRSINKMKVRFVTDKNRSHISTLELGDFEFDLYEEGMPVAIYYASSNPNVVRIDRE